MSKPGWGSSFLVVLLACAAAGVGPAAAGDGRAYAIRLTRPVSVGDTYRYVCDATVLQTMSANLSGWDKTLKPESLTLHFEATERVLAVSPRGEPTRADYSVEKCVARDGKRERILLDRGRVITVEAGRWKPSFRLDRGVLTLHQEMALRGVITMPNLKEVSLDDAFGTTKPQKVGDSWPVNPEALAKWVAVEGVQIDSQRVSGNVKLKGVEVVGGVQCLVVQGRAVVQQWLMDSKELPPGMRAEPGTDEIKFTRAIPMSGAGHCLVDSSSDRATLKVKNDDPVGPDITVDMKVLKSSGIKRTPVRVAAVASGAQ